MRTLPFFGQGVAFPFRIDPATGGVVVTEGNDDNASVALQYISERWTIREDVDVVANHIAESIAHILLTHPLEHDTLPPFGSYLYQLIFEPNNEMFQLEASHWFSFSTDRWEKRARIPPNGGTTWLFDGFLTDRGELPVVAKIRFLVEQMPENLVAPFVTIEHARLQEYPSSRIDNNRHDLNSRYWGEDTYFEDNYRFIRLPRLRLLSPAPDDQFYKVKPKDTWLLISWELYGDIRFWHLVAQMYSNDSAASGMSRDFMDNTGDPDPGTVLRAPSRTRLLTELSGMM